MADHAAVKHDYHLVNPSPWPLIGSIAATVTLFVRARGAKASGLLNAARIVAVAFVALHPLWTLGTLSGDCGYMVRYSAPVVLLMHVGLLLVVWRAARAP